MRITSDFNEMILLNVRGHSQDLVAFENAKALSLKD
jgi:hypothetical protein